MTSVVIAAGLWVMVLICLYFVVAVVYCCFKISKSGSHQPAGETSTTTPLYQVAQMAPDVPMFLPDEPYISREE